MFEVRMKLEIIINNQILYYKSSDNNFFFGDCDSFIVLCGFCSINVDFSICFDIIFIDLIYVLLNVDDFMGVLGNVLILRNLLVLVR